MKKSIISALTISLLSSFPALSDCHDPGPIVLKGTASKEALIMADGKTSYVWIFTTPNPICIRELNGDDSKYNKEVSRFQILGSPPPVGIPLELTGSLSIENVTQYYAVPDAITVTKGKKLNSNPEPEVTSPINKESNNAEGFNASERAAPIEKKAILFNSSPDSLHLIDQLVTLVRHSGFVCSSVSAANPMILHSGFSLTCDNFAHSYDIKDMGGTWVVTVDN
ncbi:hypothetical protein SC206_18300 [Rouxiella sp. T17]|uniref:hypothetical protein n=1 Tax=Rouxiella sp. T17 TaxID=3085684 RepID=UPI002FCA1C7D